MSESALPPKKPNSSSNASRRFSSAACDYDHHARIQRNAALHLQQWLDHQVPTQFNPKTCIDIGSGTGFLTNHLLTKYPNSAVHAVDLAQGMLTELTRKYPTARLHTHLLNGENLSAGYFGGSKDSLLVSGMCAQWFNHLEEAIHSWLSVSNIVAFSLLLDGSFQAWETAHHQTGQTSGLLQLPNEKHLQNIMNKLSRTGMATRTTYHTRNFLDHHPNGLSFARNLRAIGADQPRLNHQPVNLRKVISALGEACTINYLIGFYYMEKQ